MLHDFTIRALLNPSTWSPLGRLSNEVKSGLISVLYKKGEREDPRNYRPISLLNNDYKIFTRILTERMNEAVVQFVSVQQNGFVPHGFIAENTALLKLLQEYCDEQNEEAMYIFLDMEKAFDRCSWAYLHKALQKLGFNEGFINYVKLVSSSWAVRD